MLKNYLIVDFWIKSKKQYIRRGLWPRVWWKNRLFGAKAGAGEFITYELTYANGEWNFYENMQVGVSIGYEPIVEAAFETQLQRLLYTEDRVGADTLLAFEGIIGDPNTKVSYKGGLTVMERAVLGQSSESTSKEFVIIQGDLAMGFAFKGKVALDVDNVIDLLKYIAYSDY